MTPRKRSRCRDYGCLFTAWRPAARAPNGAVRLGHLSPQHRDRVGAYTARMHRTKDITPVAAEAFEVIEEIAC